ncbi:hypothetical protein FQN60_003437, partial [Etheostoma spectabile]
MCVWFVWTVVQTMVQTVMEPPLSVQCAVLQGEPCVPLRGVCGGGPPRPTQRRPFLCLSSLTGPEVRRQYPEDYTEQETLQTVPKFCFPFSMDSLTVNQVGQNFTFVLTDIESKQRFGFCRLSSGAHTCYCILSYLPWFEESQWQEFLVTLHTLPVPEPGVPVHLGVHSFFTVPDIRELPTIPENRNLTEYFVAVDVNNMLHLYASMLYERRILICCSKLSTLTACVHGSTAMLAPMPYLIGVHSSLMEGEPITFNEETFVNHRSNAMRPFLQNAIQLQLFKQFIDGRLDLLNSGEGFSDVFEEEINMGEYAGSDRTYHQWLFTVKKGGGAIFNTVKTKANPAMKTVYKFAKDHAKMRIKEVKSRLKQKVRSSRTVVVAMEQAENGFSTVSSAVAYDDNTASSALRREGPLQALDDHRPITVHFGQVAMLIDCSCVDILFPAPGSAPYAAEETEQQRESGEQRGPVSPFSPPATHSLSRGPLGHAPTLSLSCCLPSPHRSSMRPTRHYTVFLSEDSSGDELQYDEDSISGFPDSFLFSVPFEWSPLPQPYRSLKEVQLMEGDDHGFGAESHTAPPSPVNDKFSNVHLLGDIFGCQDEPDSQPITSAKSLEDLRTPKDSEELQTKFTYQRMDLSVGEHSRTLPGLKLSNPYNKLWSLGQDQSSWSICVPPACDRPSPVQPSHSPSRESSGSGPEPLDSLDPSTPGNITIPRPHGRKTPELGTALAPPAAQSRSKTAGMADGRTTSGGQEFRQALSMSTDGEVLKPSRTAEDSLDLISLLDPLNSSAASCSTSLSDGLEIRLSSSSCRPTLAPRSYPQVLPPFPLHQPHISLNPFAPQSLQHPSPQMHYSPTVSGNPFSVVYGPAPGSYHTQSYSTLPGLYRQHSPGTSTLPPNYGLLQPAFPPPAPSMPHFSASNHALSSLADSSSVPSHAGNVLAKPLHAEGDNQKTQDPFGDLLTMAKPATPQKKKVEDLRR